MYHEALSYIEDVTKRVEMTEPNEYRLRKKEATRALVDEEWPLAVLLKILHHPNRSIQIEYHGKDYKYDATMKLSGTQSVLEDWDNPVPVEVTAAYHEHAPYLREELAQKGHSYGPPDIHRAKNGEVISKAAVVEADNLHNGIATEAVRCLRKKYKKDYPPNTIILCALFDQIPLPHAAWDNIHKLVWDSHNGSIPYLTYIVDTFTCQYTSVRKTQIG